MVDPDLGVFYGSPPMADTYQKSASNDRKGQYQDLIPQIEALVQGEPDLIANLSNIAAALKEEFEFLWIGFYLIKEGELVLGPFQGPVACTRIPIGKGVCGKAATIGETIIVDNVNSFPGHIACSPLSKSEIVVPIRDQAGQISMVLDVDSERLADFSQEDRESMEQLGRLISRLT